MSIEYIPEIWTPRIGQRVKCMPSPECRRIFRLGNVDIGYKSDLTTPHAPQSYGRTGKVRLAPNGFPTPGSDHTTLVVFDNPFPLPPYSRSIESWFFAAAELVPVFALGDRIRIREAARYCAHRHVGEPGQVGRIVNRYDSDSGHIWTVALDELGLATWSRPMIDEFQDEEIEPV